jgi:tetratricopeptide (TPR) repeat protein
MHLPPPLSTAVSPRRLSAAALAMGALVMCALAGCAVKPDPMVQRGYEALAARDHGGALAAADQRLRASRTGPGVAEAWYLRGRALEMWPAANPGEAAANFAAARTAYENALANNPPRDLRAYARASLGNVAYFQDDYQTAAEMFRLAYDDLDNDVSRAWTLYRAGMSAQRQGRFETADKLFDDVIRRYPGTMQAERSAASRGARAFHVRVGTYSTQGRAQQAATDLRRQGFAGLSILPTTTNLHVLRIGPYPSYPAARGARLQLLTRFPDAMIMP